MLKKRIRTSRCNVRTLCAKYAYVLVDVAQQKRQITFTDRPLFSIFIFAFLHGYFLISHDINMMRDAQSHIKYTHKNTIFHAKIHFKIIQQSGGSGKMQSGREGGSKDFCYPNAWGMFFFFVGEGHFCFKKRLHKITHNGTITINVGGSFVLIGSAHLLITPDAFCASRARKSQ